MIAQRVVSTLSQYISEQIRMRLNAQSLLIVVGGVQQLKVQIGPDGTHHTRTHATNARFHFVVTQQCASFVLVL